MTKISNADGLVQYMKLHTQEKEQNIGWWNQTQLVVVSNGKEKYLEARQLSYLERIFAYLFDSGCASKSEIRNYCITEKKNDVLFNLNILNILKNKNGSTEKAEAPPRVSHLNAEDDKKIVAFFNSLFFERLPIENIEQGIEALPVNCMEYESFKTGMKKLAEYNKTKPLIWLLEHYKINDVELLSTILYLPKNTPLTKEKFELFISEPPLRGQILEHCLKEPLLHKIVSAAIQSIGSAKFELNYINEDSDLSEIFTILADKHSLTPEQIVQNDKLIKDNFNQNQAAVLCALIKHDRKDLFNELFPSFNDKTNLENVVVAAIKNTKDQEYWFSLYNEFDTDLKSMREPLGAAAGSNNLTALKALMLITKDLNAKNSAGDTALMSAVKNNKNDAINMLLDHRITSTTANPNIQDDNGDTPLMVAIRNSTLSIMHTLLKNGAAQNLSNHEGETALSIAQKMRNEQALIMLNTA